MGLFFGKPKQENPSVKKTNKVSKVTQKDQAILDLKIARDKLKRFQKKNETESRRLQNQAKELMKIKQTNRALLTLKLKKHKDTMIDNIEAQLFSILRMIEDIEWETANVQVFNALKLGNEALKQLHNEVSIDDVEKLMEDTNESIEVENEINRLLAGQANKFDEAELLDELDRLTTPKKSDPSDILASLPNVPTHVPTLPNFPSVPTHVPELASDTIDEPTQEVEKRVAILS